MMDVYVTDKLMAKFDINLYTFIPALSLFTATVNR